MGGVDNPSVEEKVEARIDMHIKNYNRMATLSILGVSAILVILIPITLVNAALGLTRYYNCVTRDANNQGTRSLADV